MTGDERAIEGSIDPLMHDVHSGCWIDMGRDEPPAPKLRLCELPLAVRRIDVSGDTIDYDPDDAEHCGMIGLIGAIVLQVGIGFVAGWIAGSL